jgi:class 3 adenylate cyclase
VLFADIKGSMSQIEDLDREAARAIVDPALAIMAEAVNRCQGHVAQSTGDGVFGLFGAPIAHERPSPTCDLRGTADAGEVASLFRSLARRWQSAGRNSHWDQYREVVMRSVGKDQSHSEYLPAGHAVGLA